jgi:hypothetical protein
MLILQGERDYQVTMEDFANWRKALSSRKDVRFMAYGCGDLRAAVGGVGTLVDDPPGRGL